MIIKANVQMGLSSLVAAKQRSFLALLGIVIGIGSVIAMVSIGIIAREAQIKQLQELGTDYVVISKGWGGFGGGGNKENAPKITFEQGIELGKLVPDLKATSPMGRTWGNATYRGQRLNSGIIATPYNFAEINKFKMLEGRYISEFDNNMTYCVVGAALANQIKSKGAYFVLGEKIRMNDKLFTIIGVLDNVQRSTMMPISDPNKTIYIPYSTYARSFDDPEVSDVIARMKDNVDPAQVNDDILNYFRLRDPGLTIDVRMAQELITQMENQVKNSSLLLIAIGSISLIVGGVGVMNVMLVSVTERRKEIGIRRALGALRRDIQLQFLIESLVLCFVGGIIGVIFGLIASYFYAAKNDWDFVFSNGAVFLGVGVSTIIGIFFGYYPARQAAKLDPIVALRSE